MNELITITVETRPNFKALWREAEKAIAALKATRKRRTAIKRQLAEREIQARVHAVHDLILEELKYHVAGHGIRLRDVDDYEIMASGALIQFRAWRKESWVQED